MHTQIERRGRERENAREREMGGRGIERHSKCLRKRDMRERKTMKKEQFQVRVS